MDNKYEDGYRINQLVDFLPEKNLLLSCNYNNRHIIYGTSSRCFNILLRNAGNVVPHKQLYDAGWESLGKEVTPNTLYQTISELRKQLKAAGIQENIIETIPRRGWRLKKETVINAVRITQSSAVFSPAPLSEPEPTDNCDRKKQKRLFSGLSFKMLVCSMLFVL